MGNEKKPDKNGPPREDADERGDHTYATDTCSRAAVAATAAAAPTTTSSASSSCSLTPPPPPPQPQPDSPVVPVDGEPRHERDGGRDDKTGPAQTTSEEDADDDDNEVAMIAAAAAAADKGKDKGPPLIDFSAVGEDVMTRPLRPAPRPADDEFPAYVPWKAAAFPAGVTGVVLTRRAAMGGFAAVQPAMCSVCRRCRCRACQRRCLAPRVRVCSADVRPDGRAADVAAACLPCVVRKTARCAELPARPLIPSSVGKWTRALMCLLCPCLSAYRRGRGSSAAVKKCPDVCAGNADVAGCECVDWAALGALDHERRGRRCCRRRRHRASDTTTVTTDSTAVYDSSSNTTNGGGPSSLSTVTLGAASTTEDLTVTKADVHNDDGVRGKPRPCRDYDHDTD